VDQGVTATPSHIGPYPIEQEVGRGGMGIVYLGRDTRLDRPVAIKVLPDTFAGDPERLARFEREARLLASLNHPNIAGIHGLEEANRRRFLVLEYVEGETLAQRIARGPLSLDDTVDVCRQIAAALEAAHEGGIVHRDLKPGNVKLTPNGDVKVLDFGLAKGGAGSGVGSDTSLSASPTITLAAATTAGVILGTAAYMSPEQARGKAVDRRTDIWSFGCVLYECLTGRQAFAGETVSDTIALILQGAPNWNALPAATPPRLRELIVRCLTKDAKQRLRDIGEARLALEGGEASTISGVMTPAAAAAPRRMSRGVYILAAALALSLLTLGTMMLRPREPQRVFRLSLPAPTTTYAPREPTLCAISPDGTMFVTAANDSGGSSSLWLRSLDGTEGRPLPGTDDGTISFWSPDGRYVVFSTQDKLKKLDIRGGTPEVLCSVASYGRGGSWGSKDVLVFAAGSEGPLFSVSKDGGTPKPVTVLDSTETGHRFPRFLPDGHHFLYASMPPRGSQFTIYIGSTDSPQREQLMIADGTPVYVEPGYLLYVRNGRVVAHRFDAGRRKLIGEPIALEDEPRRSDFLGSPSVIAATRGGAFLYYRHVPVLTRLGWVDSSSEKLEVLPLPTGPYESVSLSPDGERAVVARRSSPGESDLWLVDLMRMTMTRFTHGPGRVDRHVWSPDGARVAYSSDRDGHWDLYEKAADGSGGEEPILKGGSLLKYPGGWSPDGQTLIYEQIGEKSGWDICAISTRGDRTPRPLLTSSFDEQNPRISADGRWLTYTSNESGRPEVYVRAYPGPGAKHQISMSGGVFPKWRSDGRQIIFVTSTGASMVEISPERGQAVGNPRTVKAPEAIVWGDPAPDFRRWLALVQVGGSNESDDLTIVLNWRSELDRR
jgi:eukaryotic-like serine/threonine-protein kinase